jgi:hypothetical protein
MLDPGDIGDGGGDEDAALHVLLYRRWERDQSSYKGTAEEAKRGVL